MSIFKFTTPKGQPFEIKGPPGLTEAQAQEIFDKQLDTGALVGLEKGMSLSAAKQLAQGLGAAASSVGQGLSGITGALGGGISSAAGQIGKLAQGAAGGAAAAVKGLVASGSGLLNKVVNTGGGGLSGILSTASGIASQTVGAVTKALGGTVQNGISVVDFAKQPTALTGIGSMNASQVTGVLAQAKNLVGQGAGALSNTLGAGSFGFNAQQLETAGYLKPGSAGLLTASGSSLSSLLKSPASFTGKDGITDIGGILNNSNLQSQIQQNLMVKSVADMGTIGIPTAGLSPQALGGMSLAAAKNGLPAMENFVKGLPQPTELASQISTDIKAGAYSVDFSTEKVAEVFKETDFPIPAELTVNRDTLDAATTRVLGNSKIPVPNYGPSIEANLYAKTSDEDLTYGGSDTVVWDRINTERLRRGLPGLAAIGYPRPSEETA